jgi:hypothetical protein
VFKWQNILEELIATISMAEDGCSMFLQNTDMQPEGYTADDPDDHHLYQGFPTFFEWRHT